MFVESLQTLASERKNSIHLGRNSKTVEEDDMVETNLPLKRNIHKLFQLLPPNDKKTPPALETILTMK